MRVITILLVLVTLYGCHRNTRYPYALTHFPEKAPPYLLRIVDAGFIGETNYECIGILDSLLTDAQVLELTPGERLSHGVLSTYPCTLPQDILQAYLRQRIGPL